jgi:hypothetical protein
MGATSKQSFVAGVQRVITVMGSDLPNRTFVLNGTTWKEKDLVAVLQSSVDAISAGDAAQIAWKGAVGTQKAAKATATPLMTSIKTYIGVTYGKTSTMYQTMFGLPQPAKPTVETKVAAVTQVKATRKARKTMGKRQRKAIKGVVAPAIAQPAAPGGGTPGGVTPDGSNGAH